MHWEIWSFVTCTLWGIEEGDWDLKPGEGAQKLEKGVQKGGWKNTTEIQVVHREKGVETSFHHTAWPFRDWEAEPQSSAALLHH